MTKLPEKLEMPIHSKHEIDAGVDKEAAHAMYEYAIGYKNAIKVLSSVLLHEDRAISK